MIWNLAKGKTIRVEKGGDLLKNGSYVFPVLVGGLVATGALFCMLAMLLTPPPSTVREKGRASEARVARKGFEKRPQRIGDKYFLDLDVLDVRDGAERIRIDVHPKALACANKGDVVAVWFYMNRYWVDAYGEMDPYSPISVLWTLGSGCGGFFLMGYFIRKARQAKRRERVMGGT